MSFKCLETGEGHAVIYLTGFVTTVDAALMRDKLFALLDSGCTSFTFEMTEVTTMNSSPLGLLVVLRQKAAEKGGFVRISGLSGKLIKKMERLKISRLFIIEHK